jgi:hypothetical protein
MSVASLTKFTVPLATDQSATSQGLLMPKLSYRFRASFDNFGVSQPKSELTKQIVSIARPQIAFNPITIDTYNSKVYLQGKPEWQETSVTLRDDAGGNVARLVGEQVQKQYDFLEQASASSGIDYKFLLRYEVLDGGNGAQEPAVIETWEMYGCMLSNVNYGELSYDNNEPMTIQLSIRYDNAIQAPVGIGVGTLVGRNVAAAVTG